MQRSCREVSCRDLANGALTEILCRDLAWKHLLEILWGDLARSSRIEISYRDLVQRPDEENGYLAEGSIERLNRDITLISLTEIFCGDLL